MNLNKSVIPKWQAKITPQRINAIALLAACTVVHNDMTIKSPEVRKATTESAHFRASSGMTHTTEMGMKTNMA